MTSLQIINPTNHARFECLKPVTFTGKVNSGIVTVELTADDKYSLGNNQVKADGSWSITYSGFTNPGKRKITAFGYDQANHEEETSIIIYVAGNISINAGKEAEVNLENEPALVRKHRLRLH